MLGTGADLHGWPHVCRHVALPTRVVAPASHRAILEDGDREEEPAVEPNGTRQIRGHVALAARIVAPASHRACRGDRRAEGITRGNGDAWPQVRWNGALTARVATEALHTAISQERHRVLMAPGDRHRGTEVHRHVDLLVTVRTPGGDTPIVKDGHRVIETRCCLQRWLGTIGVGRAAETPANQPLRVGSGRPGTDGNDDGCDHCSGSMAHGATFQPGSNRIPAPED